MTEQEKQFKTWGIYFNYPSCCVDDFVERIKNKQPIPIYMKDSVFQYSGFIPCRCCHNKVKSMSVEDASNLLIGRNPFKDDTVYKTLEVIEEPKFKSIAYRIGFDVESYRKRLERIQEEKEKCLQKMN